MTPSWATLDQWGFAAARYLLEALWQSTLVFAAVAALSVLLRRHTPRARRALWLLALLIAPALPWLSTLAKPAGLPQQPVVEFPTYAPPVITTTFEFEPEPEPAVAVSRPVEIPAPTITAPAPTPFDYPWALALLAYTLGATLFLAWTLLGHFRIHQWMRSGRTVTDSSIIETFQRAGARLNVRRPVRVILTDRVPAPITAGIIRPTVLLPHHITTALTPDDLYAVALHETVHIKHHEPLILTLASLIRGILFCHPLVWLACRRLAVLAEHTADDAVLDITGAPTAYASLLTTFAERLPLRTPATAGAAGLVFCKSAFLKRVETILGDRQRIRKLTRLALVATVSAVVISLAAALAFPLGQKAEGKSPEQPNDPTEKPGLDQAANGKMAQPIGDLIKSLDSTQGGTRETVLNALKDMGPAAQEAIPALIKALSAYPEQTACHWIASEALARIGPAAVPALEQAAASDDVTLKVWATAALLSNKEADPARWRILAEAIQGKDRAGSTAALRAVELLGPKAAPLVSQVTEVLRVPDFRRREALMALARIGQAASPALPEVLTLLDVADPLVWVEALLAVKAMEGADRKAAIPKLVAALGANDTSDAFGAGQQPRIRAGAAEALGSIGPEAREAMPGLIKLLDDPDEFVRTAAVEAIGRIDPVDPNALPGLLKAMRDSSIRVQYAANRVVLAVGPVNIEVIRALIQAIRDNAKSYDPSGAYDGPADNIVPVSEDFINCLGSEHLYAVPDFVSLAKDPNPGVQRVAMTALKNIGDVPEEFVPMLTQHVRDSSSAWAESALVRLGPKAAPAVPALTQMLRDRQARALAARESAARILAAIGRPAADPAIPAMEQCIKETPTPPLVNLCDSLLKLDPGSTTALDGLERVVANSKTNPRDGLYARALLARYGRTPADHVNVLIAGLAGVDEEMRALSAKLLLQTSQDAQVRQKALDEAFLLMEKGADAWIQSMAAGGLRELVPADKEVLPRLIKIAGRLREAKTQTARDQLVSVITGIGRLGPSAREALPTLKELCQNKDWRVRRAAIEATSNIESPNSLPKDAHPAPSANSHDSPGSTMHASPASLTAKFVPSLPRFSLEHADHIVGSFPQADEKTPLGKISRIQGHVIVELNGHRVSADQVEFDSVDDGKITFSGDVMLSTKDQPGGIATVRSDRCVIDSKDKAHFTGNVSFEQANTGRGKASSLDLDLRTGIMQMEHVSVKDLSVGDVQIDSTREAGSFDSRKTLPVTAPVTQSPSANIEAPGTFIQRQLNLGNEAMSKKQYFPAMAAFKLVLAIEPGNEAASKGFEQSTKAAHGHPVDLVGDAAAIGKALHATVTLGEIRRSLADTVKTLTEQTGMRIDVDPAAEKGKAEAKGQEEILIGFDDAELGDALRSVTRRFGLDYVVFSDRILLTTPDKAQALGIAASSSGQGGGTEPSEGLETRLYVLPSRTPEEAARMVEALKVSVPAVVDANNGQTLSSVEFLPPMNQLKVKNTPTNLKVLEELIPQLATHFSATDPPERKVHFPADQSLGKIALMDATSYDTYWWQWPFNGPEAVGEVTIPAGKVWALQINEQVKEDPALLDRLPADELRVLSVDRCDAQQFSDLIRHLARFSNLGLLNLQYVDIETADFGPLASMPQLIALNVTSGTLGEPGFSQISRLKQLQRLSLHVRGGFSKATLESIGGLSELRDLILSSLVVDSAGMAALGRLTKLDTLTLKAFDALTTEGYANLAKIVSLKKLSLLSTTVTPEKLAELAKHPSLESLTLNERVSDELLAKLRGLRSLKTLKLDSHVMGSPPSITEPGFASLGEMKNLETLDISLNGKTSDESLRSLASLPKLKVLRMANREDVTDNQMPIFAQMRALEELRIRAGKVTDEGLSKLSGLKSLKKLVLFPGEGAQK